jgi:ring-1,2-phenylacetyl-CoA epoxidase subunit PaaC
MWSGELFEDHPMFEKLDASFTRFSSLKDQWLGKVAEVFKIANLVMPSPELWMQTGGRFGIHSAHLGFLLAEMQSLPRTYPDATW